MTEKTAENFIEALRELEANENIEQITSLFASDAKIGNAAMAENSHERQINAREFWTNYRRTFGEVKSEFRNKIISENAAALEWTTEGTSKDGEPISYEGVSILETEGEKISRFFAYFNPGALGRQISEETKAQSG